MLKWVLLLMIINSNDGADKVSFTQIQFEHERLCYNAKTMFLAEHNSEEYRKTSKQVKAYCFKIRE